MFVISLLTWIFLGTPILFRQQRPGYKGQAFITYKFRTMTDRTGPDGKLLPDAERLTTFGRWLRRTSLDDLPQLWNVLRGEMSLVGPRPLPTLESLQCLPWQRQRLWVAPGMTCIWQIWGRNTVPFDEWMRMDLQ